MRYLLLSCSDDKSNVTVPIPAIERYNGPAYKTLRRYFRQYPEARFEINVAIISAKYGLIFPQTLIPSYDQRMTLERAQIFAHTVPQQLHDWLRNPHPDADAYNNLTSPESYRNRTNAGVDPSALQAEQNADDVEEQTLQTAVQTIETPEDYVSPDLFYMVGKDYQPCTDPESTWLPEDLTVHRAHGGFMAQRMQLLAWLQDKPIPQTRKPGRIPASERAQIRTPNGNLLNPEMSLEVTGAVRLGGIDIVATPEEIEELVAGWLQDPLASYGYNRTRHWTATVGPYIVAPKWLVSRISGLPVSAFAAADARRVLARLGIPMTEHPDNPFRGASILTANSE
jgi:hypothetical protein